MLPLHCAGSPTPNTERKIIRGLETKGNKIISGSLTLAFSGAQKRAQMLCYPCILRGAQLQAQGVKKEAVPNKGGQNQKGLPHLCLLGGPKEGENGAPPLQYRES